MDGNSIYFATVASEQWGFTGPVFTNNIPHFCEEPRLGSLVDRVGELQKLYPEAIYSIYRIDFTENGPVTTLTDIV